MYLSFGAVNGGENFFFERAKRLLVGLMTSLYFLFFAPSDGTVLISDYTMSKMIELTTKEPFCRVHTDRGEIRSMMLSSDPRKVRQMTDESIGKLEEVCKNDGVKSGHQGGFIYPGTKWCGPGDVASNYSDLGFHKKEDMCCREHDNCKDYLSAGECRQGICNSSPYTRSHCDCDATFRRCLQNVNTETANTIGAIFFNVVQVICFKERSPCSQWQSAEAEQNELNSSLPEDFATAKNETDCLVFVKSDRFEASTVTDLTWDQKPEFFLNILLRKLRNGYSKAESDELCARWKYRPSEKYIPLMPTSTH